MLLETAEIEELTKRTKPSAQAKVLRGMGIPSVRRGDGSLAVSRMAVELALGGVTKSEARKEAEPDFGAIHAA